MVPGGKTLEGLCVEIEQYTDLTGTVPGTLAFPG